MRKFNNRFSQALMLGTFAAISAGIPAQAQFTEAPTPAGVGAAEILDGCEDLSFLEKCDPNADVTVNATGLPGGQPGLSGSFNVRPLGAPAGLALEGTGLADPNGDPLTNIDFSGPSQVRRVAPGSEEVELAPGQDPNAIGEFDVLSATGDFQGLLGWEGTIKDLVVPGFGEFRGAAFPGSTLPSGEPAPRVTDFVVINQPNPAGDGIIDGVGYSGIALDLVDISFPSYDPPSGNNPQTTVSIQFTAQAYKLDAQGRRIEEQEILPGDQFSVFGNEVTGRLSASFDFPPDEVRSEFDELGELLAWFGYDITFESTPVNKVFPLGEGPVIPEPTTIISSLLLMSGGAFKLAKRKRA